MAISFAMYMAIFYYKKEGSYPIDCDIAHKRRIKYQAAKYEVTTGDRLVELETGRELLHSGNAEEVVRRVHMDGHSGVNLTESKVRNAFVVSGLHDLVKLIVKHCETCQFTAKAKFMKKNVNHYMRTPTKVMEVIACDAIGPIPRSDGNNEYILTAICLLTRWPIARAVPNINEETTYKFIFEEIVLRYGCCRFFLTDRGSNFTSEFMKSALRQLEVKGITTTAYRANCNGICERFNQTLISVMKKLSRDESHAKNWDEYINNALLCIRTTVNSATGYTPSYLLYGYEMRTPSTWTPATYDYVEGELDEAIIERCNQLENDQKRILLKARQNSDERKARDKIRYDAGVHRPKTFEIGEKVLLLDMQAKGKFSDTFVGPFTIVRVNQNGTYHLTGENSRKIRGAINGDRLTDYRETRKMVPVVANSDQDIYQRWMASKKKIYTVSFNDELRTCGGARVVETPGFMSSFALENSHSSRHHVEHKPHMDLH